MNILIVDDHILFREGLISLVSRQPDFNVVGEAGTVAEAILMARTKHPDMILMDFTLPDGTGLDAMHAILAENPLAKIVFLTIHEDDERLFGAIRAGAKGYLLKNIPVAKLVAAIRGMEMGEAPISRQMTMRILDEFSHASPNASEPDSRLTQLTGREIEILRELATNATNQEIANRMYISESTVKNHVHNILDKLGLNNRREAVDYARRNGLRMTGD
ncbi:MAG TPA: response regulator transcription factor [Anaerolineaceae bacterium]|nr:response regulator transcription factor [Anaerolineaceae bacterium]